MSNKITVKTVQRHFVCVCGKAIVDEEEVCGVRYKDFKLMGIKRKRDKKTGKPFLYWRTFWGTCTCDDLPF